MNRSDELFAKLKSRRVTLKSGITAMLPPRWLTDQWGLPPPARKVKKKKSKPPPPVPPAFGELVKRRVLRKPTEEQS